MTKSTCQREIPRSCLAISTRSIIIAAAHLYLGVLILWLVLYLLVGDRDPYLGLFNYIALYLFVPLPFVFLIAALTRRRELWVGFALGLITFMQLWGRQLIPIRSRANVGQDRLRAMSFNVWGGREDVAAAVAIIRYHDPDVVFIQELNHELALTLEQDLAQDYPYQVLDPERRYAGMGVVSKFPLEPADVRLPLRWVGVPQVLRLSWGEEKLTLINFHMWPTGIAPREVLRNNFRAREAQALALSEFADRSANMNPVIAAGDGNFSPLNAPHQILSESLLDSWHEAGWGLGHTFPAGRAADGRLPRLSGVPVPPLFYRIDYIFHTPDLTAVAAGVAHHDGISDHRAVVVELTLAE
jgi:endonuclease/exonuclease/phosphatase (EEP) superfamily protein YafD